MRTSLNRERRSEDRLPDQEEEEEEEPVVVIEEVEEKDEGNCLSKVACSFNGNGEESLGRFKELEARVEGCEVWAFSVGDFAMEDSSVTILCRLRGG